MDIKRLTKGEGRERDSRTHARRPPVKVKYIKYKINPDKNVNMEVNFNDIDSHGIKTGIKNIIPQLQIVQSES